MKKIIKKLNKFFIIAGLLLAVYFLMLSPEMAQAADASSITGTITDNGNGTCTLVCNNNTGIRVQACVSYNDNATKVYYDLGYYSNTIVVPLNAGNREYLVRLLYNIEDNRYAAFVQQRVNLNLQDENLPFALANRIVNYKLSDNIINESMELVKGCKTELEIVQKIHRFVLEKYSYDHDLAANPPSNYIPDVQHDYVVRKGICYDYSVIFAAMLRIHGIETKVVFGFPAEDAGYKKGAYHAWNQIYDSASKSWYTVDITYDSCLYHDSASYAGMTFTLKKNNNLYTNISYYY